MVSVFTRARFVLLILICCAIYVLPVYFFMREGPRPHATDAGSRDVALQLKISVAEFQKETVTFHIVPVAGKVVDSNGQLKQDIELALDPGTGQVAHTFKSKMPLIPWSVPVAIDSGDILLYPFDQYDVEFEVEARSEGRNLSVIGDLKHVPHGLVTALQQQQTATGGSEIAVSLKRSGSNLFVVGLSTLSLILVTLGACAVAWHVAYRGRKIEFSMMTWTAALLFVIPAVRNALPGAPPAGALIDFLIFFWLQVIVVVATASMVITWTRRSTG